MYLLLPLITWGRTHGPKLRSRTGVKGSQARLVTPRGAWWEEAPELITWQGRNWGLGH